MNMADSESCGSCSLAFAKDEIIVKCYGFCGKVFHGGCTSLSNNEIRLLKPKTGIVWLCADCRSLTGDGQSFLHMLLQINNQIQAHGKLLEQHNYALQEVSTKLSESKISRKSQDVNNKSQSNVNAISKQQMQPSVQPAIQVSNNSGRTGTTKINQKVASSVTIKQLSDALDDVNGKSVRDEEFIPVTHRKDKRRQRRSITGTALVTNSSLMAVVPEKRAWFHVSRYPLTTTAAEVQEMLVKRFDRSDFVCEKITTGHPAPTFSSFKIGSDFSLMEQMQDPAVWAQGINISRYVFFRQPPNLKKTQSLA